MSLEESEIVSRLTSNESILVCSSTVPKSFNKVSFTICFIPQSSVTFFEVYPSILENTLSPKKDLITFVSESKLLALIKLKLGLIEVKANMDEKKIIFDLFNIKPPMYFKKLTLTLKL